MLIDHSSAAFFLLEFTSNDIQIQQRGKTSPTTFNCSSFNCQVPSLRGLFSQQKITRKIPNWPTEQHLHLRWRPSLFWVPSHPVFSSLVLQADLNNWCFKPKISQADSTERRQHTADVYSNNGWPPPPKFNSKSPWKMMVGRRSFPIGKGSFWGAKC